jgi:hypothetical protein
MKQIDFTRLTVIAGAAMLFGLTPLKAQIGGQRTGYLSGSYETNTIWYFPDKDRDLDVPDGRFGSNNYLKFDYVNGHFSAGIQYEIYAPVLQGFNANLKGGKFMNKYAAWTDKNFSVLVGDIYEQFGSGLVLRTYEDRALGFNNSLEGARVKYNFNNYVQVTGLIGRPRMYMDYADAWVRGADASISVSEIIGMRTVNLAIEGSYVNRRDNTEAIGIVNNFPSVNAYSARLAFEAGGFALRGELMTKSTDTNAQGEKKGSAQLVELSYNHGGLGIFATFRRMKNATFAITPTDNTEGNVLNYLPSLTQQTTYMLTNLDPYIPDYGGLGEQGGMLDVFYNFKKGTALGGARGMKLHINGAAFMNIDKRSAQNAGNNKQNIMYAAGSIDVEKYLSKDFKLIFMYNMQAHNPNHGDNDILEYSHIFVADGLYKFNRKTSLRLELQYLFTPTDKGDWWGALAEVNLAPRWSFYVSDMYNWGNKEENVKRAHFYNAGLSYAYSRTRVSLGYGRTRAGYVCSGGVCRLMPAYTGFNFTITTSF